MKNTNPGISCAFYTVKQLAALFGKSEDTIRRWKNEGVGKEEDNIKLRAVEREDGLGRKNARHLVFSREAVIEFVKANPFLMDDAPQLNMMMQAEGAWTGGAIPMPGTVAAYAPPESDDDADDEFSDDYLERFIRRGDGVASVKKDRTPEFEQPDFTRRPQRRPWNSVLSDFEKSDKDDPVYHPKADPRTEDEPDPWERENLRPFSAYSGGDAPGGDDEFEDDEIPGPHHFDPFEARARAGFGPLPREPRSRRDNAAEMKRKREMLLYVVYVLESHMGELEDELDDVSISLRELNTGGISQRGADTMRRMLSSRREELTKKIGYISDFVELLEEE